MTDRISEIRARCEAATQEMLRIHREMLDICNMGFSDRDAAWFYVWIAEWFNAIKQHWPFDDIPYLLDRLAETEEELKQADDYIETYKDICDKHVETNRKLIAEVKRLREAINGIVWEWDNGHIETYSPYVRDYIDQLRPLAAPTKEGESK